MNVGNRICGTLKRKIPMLASFRKGEEEIEGMVQVSTTLDLHHQLTYQRNVMFNTAFMQLTQVVPGRGAA